jgi:hypothetical protein
MVQLVRHRQTKGPATDRLHLNHRATSRLYLFSARMGFPSLATNKFRGDETMEITLAHGTRTVTLPLVDIPVKDGASHFYQPMIQRRMMVGDPRYADGFYDNVYVRGMCQNYDEGRGKVFQLRGEQLEEYPASHSIQWIPPSDFNRNELGGELALQAIDWQDALYMNPPPAMDELSPEARKRIERIIQGNRSIHASFREAFIKQAPRG